MTSVSTVLIKYSLYWTIFIMKFRYKDIKVRKWNHVLEQSYDSVGAVKQSQKLWNMGTFTWIHWEQNITSKKENETKSVYSLHYTLLLSSLQPHHFERGVFVWNLFLQSSANKMDFGVFTNTIEINHKLGISVTNFVHNSEYHIYIIYQWFR